MFMLKIPLALLAGASLSLACDLPLGGQGGINPILVTLQPGIAQTWTWDFTDCNTPIWNFTAYVTQPRDKHGHQSALPANTPLSVSGLNVTTGQIYPSVNFTIDFGQPAGSSVGGQVIQLNLINSGRKPLDVEISYSAAL